MLGRNEHHIVRLSADRHVRKKERLSVDITIHSLGKEFAKLRGIYIGRIQDGLIEVLPGPSDVIAPGSYTNLSIHRQTAERQKKPRSKQRPQAAAHFRRRTACFVQT